MKKILLVWIVNILLYNWLVGQSTTMKIVPDFYKRNSELITNEFQLLSCGAPLEFVGLSCYHSDKNNVDIFYRMKTEEGWSDWLEFSKQHEFVQSNRFAYSTKPIHNLFSDIQFKISEKINTSLTIRLFLACQKEEKLQIIKRSINCEIPEICERDCWCSTCTIDESPLSTKPTHLIVHHSAGNNQSANFSTVVEYIWDLHVNTNGWDDIGYNWIIDPNGILYKGRSDNIQGAHFSCMNENTVGICIIGDYSFVEPSEAALSSLVNLLAYEASEHFIDINAKSYHVNGDFILDNLAGHRDSKGSDNACSTTVCPGDSFYPLLQDIKLRISKLPCYNVLTSIEKDINFYGIKVFPNPVHQYLTVVSENEEVQSLEIVNLYGKSLGFLNSERPNDVSLLQPGVYFLIYKGELFKKMIKI